MLKLSKLKKKTRSMRVRISIGVFAILSVVFLSVWVAIAERAARGLDGYMDESLESFVDILVQEYSSRGNPNEGERKGREVLSTSGDFLFEIRNFSTGRLLSRSTHFESNFDLLGGESMPDVIERTSGDGWNQILEEKSFRCFAEVASIPRRTAGQPRDSLEEVLIVVAQNRSEADRRLQEIFKRSGMGLLLALFLAVFGVWAAILRGLRPLSTLTKDVKAFTPEKTVPVRVPDDPGLAVLARRLNDSLQAMARSLEREKRFSSDVAHELLTPLGGLRTSMDVALLGKRSEDDLRSAIKRCGCMVIELQQVIENLLELGRLESGTQAEERSDVALREAVDHAWAAVPVPPGRPRIELRNDVDENTQVRTAPRQLDLILGNLLRNARKYTKAEGKAWVECEESGEKVTLRVLNEPGEVAPNFAEHAFEPFWRGDPSRTREANGVGDGAGLGLSLAHTAARALGGDLTLDVRPGPLVCFTLVLRTATAGLGDRDSLE